MGTQGLTGGDQRDATMFSMSHHLDSVTGNNLQMSGVVNYLPPDPAGVHCRAAKANDR